MLIFFACFSVTMNHAQQMSIVWPKHNEVVSDRTPLLSWNGLEGIQSYQIILSTDSTFNTGTQQFTSSSTSYQIANNLSSGTWFWKVSGSLNGQFLASNLGKFEVFEPTDIPNLSVWLTSDSLITLDASNRVSSWGNINGTNHFTSAGLLCFRSGLDLYCWRN